MKTSKNILKKIYVDSIKCNINIYKTLQWVQLIFPVICILLKFYFKWDPTAGGALSDCLCGLCQATALSKFYRRGRGTDFYCLTLQQEPAVEDALPFYLLVYLFMYFIYLFQMVTSALLCCEASVLTRCSHGAATKNYSVIKQILQWSRCIK